VNPLTARDISHVSYCKDVLKKPHKVIFKSF
jgi:hypothetical protein